MDLRTLLEQVAPLPDRQGCETHQVECTVGHDEDTRRASDVDRQRVPDRLTERITSRAIIFRGLARSAGFFLPISDQSIDPVGRAERHDDWLERTATHHEGEVRRDRRSLFGEPDPVIECKSNQRTMSWNARRDLAQTLSFPFEASGKRSTLCCQLLLGLVFFPAGLCDASFIQLRGFILLDIPHIEVGEPVG